jgi:GT2 family glycosyltransferase
MVSVLVVTWNSAAYLEHCLDSLDRQEYRDLEVIVVDNASNDATQAILRERETLSLVIWNQNNVGFAAAQNQTIRAAKGEWLLCLNPDVVLSPSFLGRLTEAGAAYPDAGSLCGKLLRLDANSLQHTQIIDSTGINFKRNMRHLDRGAEEMDQGQYDRMEWVFGATGAAAMFRRSLVDGVSIDGQFFDESFFAYREDADLAWRAQLMGRKCLYVPSAVAWHVRRVTPERREQLPLAINWHSVKNRFLMRGKNASGWLCWKLFLPVAWRDLMVFGYAVLRDWRLLSAIAYPFRNFGSIRNQRKVIQARRRVSDRDLIWWFCDTPRAVDVRPSNAAKAVAADTVPSRTGDQP